MWGRIWRKIMLLGSILLNIMGNFEEMMWIYQISWESMGNSPTFIKYHGKLTLIY